MLGNSETFAIDSDRRKNHGGKTSTRISSREDFGARSRIPEISDLCSSRRTTVRHVRGPLVSSRPSLSSESAERQRARRRDSEQVKREDDPLWVGWPSKLEGQECLTAIFQ